ncbi:DUF2182 domain-containing protein [Paralimibaculum aggregatum]|uniref:DUF2182 domain-containing protein n=1 Tax=Paralimibaculum aggregatum TaxID=3036245 RepID=A0ABQ6LFC4_9RHOB|nr:DUF2182 domain-containing protein [Limibaculum sp. NKW23]GMG82035.1 DUF2182 domain-containing protein [Limibaculum sp. NKW23]
MPGQSFSDPNSALSRRPRLRLGAAAPAWIGLYALLLAAWAALWAMDPGAGLPRGAGFGALADLCLTAARDASLPGLWAMWAVMGAAMMLPTALPALRDYARIAETAASRGAERAPWLALLGLAGGYLAVWWSFALLAAAAQARLSAAGWLGLDGTSTAPLLTAALLLGAGAWQFSHLKALSLGRCRQPFMTFLAGWRPGFRPAFATGLRLGIDCLGCCWALMGLAFVGGMSNLLWMGAATLIMALEKLPEIGRPLTRPLGLALIGAGVFTASLELLPLVLPLAGGA